MGRVWPALHVRQEESVLSGPGSAAGPAEAAQGVNKECGKVGARLQPLPHSLSQELFLMENEITWMVSEDPPTSQFSSLWFSPQCSVAVEMRAGSQLGPGYQHHAQPKRKKP